MTRTTRRSWGTIRRLPSGKFQASYIHHCARHTAPMTYSVRTAAEGWLHTERSAIERGDWTPPAARTKQAETAGLTLADYAWRWLAHHNIKPRTRQQYQALLTNHITGPAGDPTPLGATPLADLTSDAVRHWYARTLTDRPAYRAQAYVVLHAIGATAVDDGHLDANPCQIKRAGIVHTRREPVILTPGEVAALANAIDDHYRALVLICANVGLRYGEATELRRKDIGPGAQTITVARGVTHHGGCHRSTTKSGRVRTVTVPRHIRADIKHHLDTYTGPGPEALLFGSTESVCGHVNSTTVRRHFNAALKASGYDGPHVRIHDLRHYQGTMVTLAGATLRDSMQRLGHSTVTASLRYQQIVAGRDAEIADALSMLATKPKLAVVVSDESSESSLSSA